MIILSAAGSGRPRLGLAIVQRACGHPVAMSQQPEDPACLRWAVAVTEFACDGSGRLRVGHPTSGRPVYTTIYAHAYATLERRGASATKWTYE